jgi:hypothetical protein
MNSTDAEVLCSASAQRPDTLAFIAGSAAPSNNAAMQRQPKAIATARRTGLALLLMSALLMTALPAASDEMRCGESLVERGFTPLEVLERCGPPQFEMRWSDYRYPGIWVRVDEWTYRLGSNKFRRLLTFENGRLVRIELRDKPRIAPP